MRFDDDGRVWRGIRTPRARPRSWSSRDRPRATSSGGPGATAPRGRWSRCPDCSAPTTTGPASCRTTRCSPTLRRRYPNARLGRTGLLMEALVPAIIEQKVTGQEAFAGFRMLVHRYGERAPGPGVERKVWVQPDAGDAAHDPVVGVAADAHRPGPLAHDRERGPGGRHARAPHRRWPPEEADRRLRVDPRHRPLDQPPRCGSAPSATPTPSASATTTWPRTSAGRSPASRSTTTSSRSSSSPTARSAAGCPRCSGWPGSAVRATAPGWRPASTCRPGSRALSARPRNWTDPSRPGCPVAGQPARLDYPSGRSSRAGTSTHAPRANRPARAKVQA